jgi:hypothetical protein
MMFTKVSHQLLVTIRSFAALLNSASILSLLALILSTSAFLCTKSTLLCSKSANLCRLLSSVATPSAPNLTDHSAAQRATCSSSLRRCRSLASFRYCSTRGARWSSGTLSRKERKSVVAGETVSAMMVMHGNGKQCWARYEAPGAVLRATVSAT